MAFLKVEIGSQRIKSEDEVEGKPSSTEAEGSIVRYRPCGGFLRLVEHLAEKTSMESAPSNQREHRPEPKSSSFNVTFDVSSQVKTLSHSASNEGTGGTGHWTLRDIKDERI